jgi:hypothetical protein
MSAKTVVTEYIACSRAISSGVSGWSGVVEVEDVAGAEFIRPVGSDGLSDMGWSQLMEPGQ